MDQSAENLAVTRDVIGALVRLGIPYALGGSMASSLLGRPRFTQDADLTVEPFTGQEAALAATLGSDYYVSIPAIEEAVRRRSSFNIIHPDSGFKVDVFVRKDRPFEQSLMARRITRTMTDRPDQPVLLISAEDIVLLKLEWYRIGNEISDRQWSDSIGVLQVQAGKLDENYLDHWAKVLRVDDLLERARKQVAESGT